MASIAQLIAVLDGMPDLLRGLLSALLLLVLLIAFDVWVARGGSLAAPPAEDDSPRARWRRLRQSFTGHRWRIAHTKTTLLALLLIPLSSALLVGVRMPVFVATAPVTQAPDYWWLHGLLLSWLLIALGLVVRQLLHWRERRFVASSESAIEVPAAIVKRAQHWQRRLGLDQAVSVQLIAIDAPANQRWPTRAVALPRAAAHWPAAATDVALIEQLCHFSLAHHPWRVVAMLVGCLYWPFSFVRRMLPQRLEQDFTVAAAELAAACYRDPLGYHRANKALQERLGPPAKSGSTATRDPALLVTDVNDPYGRVFLVFIQMVLTVYVLTGATLREIPDDSNFRYAEFVDDWYQSFARSMKYAPEPPESRGAVTNPPGAPSTPPTPAPER